MEFRAMIVSNGNHTSSLPVNVARSQVSLVNSLKTSHHPARKPLMDILPKRSLRLQVMNVNPGVRFLTMN
jgi:hypothetical protein